MWLLFLLLASVSEAIIPIGSNPYAYGCDALSFCYNHRTESSINSFEEFCKTLNCDQLDQYNLGDVRTLNGALDNYYLLQESLALENITIGIAYGYRTDVPCGDNVLIDFPLQNPFFALFTSSNGPRCIYGSLGMNFYQWIPSGIFVSTFSVALDILTRNSSDVLEYTPGKDYTFVNISVDSEQYYGLFEYTLRLGYEPDSMDDVTSATFGLNAPTFCTGATYTLAYAYYYVSVPGNIKPAITDYDPPIIEGQFMLNTPIYSKEGVYGALDNFEIDPFKDFKSNVSVQAIMKGFNKKNDTMLVGCFNCPLNTSCSIDFGIEGIYRCEIKGYFFIDGQRVGLTVNSVAICLEYGINRACITGLPVVSDLGYVMTEIPLVPPTSSSPWDMNSAAWLLLGLLIAVTLVMISLAVVLGVQNAS